MKDFFGEDLCAAAAQAYMESLLSGESGAKASEAAEIAYKAAMILARTRSQTPLLPLPSPGLDLRRATPAPSPPRPTWSRSLAESRSTMPGSALPRLSSELLPTLPSPATLWSTPPAPRRPSPSSGTPMDPTPPPPTLPRPSSTPP